MWEHKTKQNPKSFTARYNVDKLIYLEEFSDVDEARAREKFLKKKTLRFKLELINKVNPRWIELSAT